MSKYFLVNNKPDDYDNHQKELVYTSLKNAKKYYHYLEIPEEDADVLRKYITFVGEADEQERTDEERFYGSD